MSDRPSKDAAGPTGTTRRLSKPSFIVASVVLLGFASMIVYMIGHVGANDRTWARLVSLLSSVEALAFGAAGAIFGSSVQRGRTVAAEKRANDNERDAVAGRTLAETIKVGARSRPAGRGPAPAFDMTMPPGAGGPPDAGGPPGDGPGAPPEPRADPYVDLARRLFPD